MNRRSPASRMNPWPMGATCVCACTAGANWNPLAGDSSINRIATVALRFDRAARTLNRLEDFIICLSLCAYRVLRLIAHQRMETQRDVHPAIDPGCER